MQGPTAKIFGFGLVENFTKMALSLSQSAVSVLKLGAGLSGWGWVARRIRNLDFKTNVSLVVVEPTIGLQFSFCSNQLRDLQQNIHFFRVITCQMRRCVPFCTKILQRVKNKQLAFSVRIVKVWSCITLPIMRPFRTRESTHDQIWINQPRQESHTPGSGLLDPANKSTRCPVKFEFQINHKSYFSISISHAIFGIYLQ